MANHFLSTNLGRFRIISFTEGLSFLILLGIAIPLKYIWHIPEAVRIVGMLHGILFITYVILLIMTAMEMKWSFIKAALLFFASIFPFGFLLAEYMFLRKQAKKAIA